MNVKVKEIMENSKHYPTHPGAEQPPVMTCEIPLEEYESLKRENAELVGVKKSAEQILQNLLDCGLIKEWYFNGKFNAVLKADDPHLKIAELKAKLESAQASMYADVVDAGMENRRLKRALWMARGYIMTLLNRDFQRLAYQCNNDDYKKNLLRRRNQYYELSEKCLKNAEEYK